MKVINRPTLMTCNLCNKSNILPTNSEGKYFLEINGMDLFVASCHNSYFEYKFYCRVIIKAMFIFKNPTSNNKQYAKW